jgi:hypothetical protein
MLISSITTATWTKPGTTQPRGHTARASNRTLFTCAHTLVPRNPSQSITSLSPGQNPIKKTNPLLVYRLQCTHGDAAQEDLLHIATCHSTRQITATASPSQLQITATVTEDSKLSSWKTLKRMVLQCHRMMHGWENTKLRLVRVSGARRFCFKLRFQEYQDTDPIGLPGAANTNKRYLQEKQTSWHCFVPPAACFDSRNEIVLWLMNHRFRGLSLSRNQTYIVRLASRSPCHCHDWYYSPAGFHWG